eukprot:s3822_g6.t6
MQSHVYWRDLSVVGSGRALLQSSTGVAKAGRLLGVLGPSGAGKSTFLSALADVLDEPLQRTGHVWSPTGTISVAKGTAALLAQDDPFFPELMVGETLQFAATLSGRRAQEAVEEAEALLQRVGLAGAASRRVSSTTKGEQRRLAVACALAGELPGARSRALLVDEPTTGLDAFQAQRVVELLKELALGRNCACVASLHQPRAAIFRCLDDTLVLAPGGHVVFCGSADDMSEHFCGLGYSCADQGVNPAEFVIDLVSIDYENLPQVVQDKQRIEVCAAAWRKRCQDDTLDMEIPRSSSFVKRRASVRAFFLLTQRSSIQIMRDRMTNVFRLVATAGLALVFGVHFGKLDGGGLPTARSVAARICLLSFGVIAMAFLAMARAVDRFAKERAIVKRERLARLYGGGVYLLSKAVTELPLDALSAVLFAAIVHEICGLHARRETVLLSFALVATAASTLGLAVGAASSTAERAVALGGPVMIVHMLTGVIDPAGQVGHSANQFMELLHGLSPIRYAIEALCVAELRGLDLARSAADAPRMGGLALVRSGDEVLRRLGVTNDFEMSVDWLLRLSALHLLAAAALFAKVGSAALPIALRKSLRQCAVIMEVASKLPIERAERIAKVFEKIDENSDGSISMEELSRLFSQMGLKDRSLQNRAFQTLDINGDGVLSFSEFSAGVLTVYTDLLEDRFLELFRRHDVNGDGMLSRAEFEAFMEKVLPLANRSVQQSPAEIITKIFGHEEDLITFEVVVCGPSSHSPERAARLRFTLSWTSDVARSRLWPLCCIVDAEKAAHPGLKFAAMGEQHQVHVWENTYIMAPKDDEKMLPSKVTAVIKNVMEGYLQDKEYAVEDAKAWTLDLSNEIKASVKQDLNIPRYKIIVQVVIGEQASQGIRVASKCLWDVNSDNWASYTFENQSLFAVGMEPSEKFAAMGEQHQVHVWENTYIMAPKDDEKMLPSKVTAVIKNASVKQDLNIPRYKIIVQVVIGEQASQGIRVASKCLWDVNSDNWASYTFENQSLFAVGMVKALCCAFPQQRRPFHSLCREQPACALLLTGFPVRIRVQTSSPQNTSNTTPSYCRMLWHCNLWCRSGSQLKTPSMPRGGNGNRSMPKFAGGASLISGIQRGASVAPSHAWTLDAKDGVGSRGKVLGNSACRFVTRSRRVPTAGFAFYLGRSARYGHPPGADLFAQCIAFCKQQWSPVPSFSRNFRCSSLSPEPLSLLSNCRRMLRNAWRPCSAGPTGPGSPGPGIEHYNQNIHNLAKRTQWQQALAVLPQLEDQKLKASVVTYNTAITACVRGAQWKIAISFLHHLQNQRLANVITFSAALSSLDAASLWAHAMILLASMEGFGVQRNSITYNAAISACANSESESWAAALWLLDALELGNTETSIIPYNSATSACANGNWDLALALVAGLGFRNLQADVVTRNALISVLEGRWQEALRPFSELSQASLQPTTVTFNSLLKVSATSAEWQRALLLLPEMELRELLVDAVSFTTALSASARGLQWKTSLILLGETKKQTAAPSVFAYNAVLSACEGHGLWELALQLIAELSKDLEPDMLTYSTGISACARSGAWQWALLLFSVLARQDAQWSAVTCNSLIRACAKGSVWRRALALLAEARTQHTEVELIAYNACISACEKAAKWEQSLAVLRILGGSPGLQADVISFNAAISACEKCEHWEEAGWQGRSAMHALIL